MVYSSLLFFIFPCLRPRRGFPILQLPDVAFRMVLKRMTVQELVQFWIVSRETARLVGLYAPKESPRGIQVRHSDDAFWFHITGEVSNNFTIEFERLLEPPTLPPRRTFYLNGACLPLTSTESKLTIHYFSDQYEPSRRLFELLFDASSYPWERAHFERATWLTDGNLLSLTSCERITLVDMRIDDEGVNRFLRRWMAGCAIEWAWLERRHPDINFERVMNGVARRYYEVPEFRQRRYTIRENEHTRIENDANVNAAFFKTTGAVALSVEPIDAEDGEVPVVRNGPPYPPEVILGAYLFCVYFWFIEVLNNVIL